MKSFSRDIDQATLLSIAREAIDEVRSKITWSASASSVTRDEFNEKYYSIFNMRTQKLNADKCLYELYSIPCNETFLKFKRHVKNSQGSEMGNCREYSYLVLNYLRKKNIPAEVIHMDEGDHYFVVINRDPNSKVNDPDNWNGVICDATLNDCYPSSEHRGRIKCRKFISDENSTLVNEYYPRTDEVLTKAMGITSECSDDYQTQLICEAEDKIKMITKAASELGLQSESMEKLSEIQQEWRDYGAKKTSDLTNNDVERAMNRMVKKALKVIINSSSEFSYTSTGFTCLCKAIMEYDLKYGEKLTKSLQSDFYRSTFGSSYQ